MKTSEANVCVCVCVGGGGGGGVSCLPRRIEVSYPCHVVIIAWWRHQMETFSALLAICAGNSPVHGEFPAQRPVTRSFDVFFDMHPTNRFSKQSLDWWFQTASRSLWRHCNGWSTARLTGAWVYWPIFLVGLQSKVQSMLYINGVVENKMPLLKLQMTNTSPDFRHFLCINFDMS